MSQNLVLFTSLMKHSCSSYLKYAVILLLLIGVSSCTSTTNIDFSQRTKIALRDVGNKLLLSQNDSTSLILPVITLDNNTYQLAFSNALGFEPTTFVALAKESFKTSNLPQYYRVEVIECKTEEVAYSYQMSDTIENTIIPCSGRFLPVACYTIHVYFTNKTNELSSIKILVYAFLFLSAVGLVILYLKRNPKRIIVENDNSAKLGSFYFYPEQNKLIKEAQEIALSKKECELLTLFVERPNEIIKRDELTKRVWEDNGVFVGRSLDTYISKLRKKLKDDTSIKLTNVHGVGYKLELDKDN